MGKNADGTPVQVQQVGQATPGQTPAPAGAQQVGQGSPAQPSPPAGAQAPAQAPAGAPPQAPAQVQAVTPEQFQQMQEALAASQAKLKAHEQANLSELEKAQQRNQELAAQLAVSERRAAFAAAGLPVALAEEQDPTKIAAMLKAATPAAGVAGTPVGAPLTPGDAGAGVPPAPGAQGAGAPNQNTDAKGPTSAEAWDAAWRKRAGIKD